MPANPPSAPGGSWRSIVGALAVQTGTGADETSPTTPMGLQFELRESSPRTHDRWRGPTTKAAEPDAADAPAESGASRAAAAAQAANKGAEANKGGAASTSRAGDATFNARAADATSRAALDAIAARAPRHLAVRPVIRRSTGSYVKANVTWGSFTHQVNRLNLEPAHHRWFAQFAGLHRATRPSTAPPEADWIALDEFTSPLLWQLLHEAQVLGIELVTSARGGAVEIVGPAAVNLDVRRTSDGALKLTPLLTLGGPVLEVQPAAAAGRRTSAHEFDPASAGRTPASDFDPASAERTAAPPISQPAHGVGADSPPAHNAGAIGDHGIYAYRLAKKPLFLLAPTARPLTPQERALLGQAPVLVPAADRELFFDEYYPDLQRGVTVTSTDDSVPLPEVPPPTLVLTARFRPGDVLQLDWDWTGHRDPAAEARILSSTAIELDAVLTRFPPTIDPLTPSLTLRGVDAAAFAEKAIPALEAMPHVRVDVIGPRPEYRELTGHPEVSVTAVETLKRDWFDLGFVVNINDYHVPFGPLFKALATGRKKLLMVDKTYLSLDHPAFDRLRDLLEEAGTLDEWETGPRISRHRFALFPAFEDLAEQSPQAVAWRASVAALRDGFETPAPAPDAPNSPSSGVTVTADTTNDSGPPTGGADTGPDTGPPTGGGGGAPIVPPTDLPAAITAHLRPYQKAGFDWLAFLWRHRLGGVLADDMGLGKTLQTLALVAHAKEQANGQSGTSERSSTSGQANGQAKKRSGGHEGDSPGDAGPAHPFLVVAPTSVVAVWAAEAARFAPSLVVRTVTATQHKSGRSIRDLAEGADVVVTSYALFRLDAGAYSDPALHWAALVLDEAQFVKNHESKLHAAARDLDVPFTLAITGTPLENNLMELWALFDLVAPGLFPSSTRFAEKFQRPIERGIAPAALATLRRRIRPFLLRRTKQAVAPELPEKQEQVLPVELALAHRHLYDTVLQRERQKLFGLIDDLDRNRFIVFRSLTLLRLLSLDATLIDEAHASIPSSKLDALIDHLQEVLAEGHRVLVFSQFTGYLGRVADRFTAEGIRFDYLDGSTTRRPQVVKNFREGDAPVFLISLKAGGFGLTLTEADYVYLLDPWWNPASENQAIDRTHRIGQANPVNVYRLVATDTIEEKVMELKRHKAKLFDAVLDDDEHFSSTLTAADIRALLT